MAPDEPSIDRPSKPGPAREIALVIGGGLLLIASACAVLHIRARSRETGLTVLRPASSDRIGEGPYIGSNACSECHPGESAAFARSGHARTLLAAELSPSAGRLDGLSVADPERPGVTWSYSLNGGRLQAAKSEGGKVERFDLEYALGSGHHATTFVTIIDAKKPVALEHRLTYYSQSGSLEITPGQQGGRPSPGTKAHGRELSPRETLKCFGCHATPVGDGPLTGPGQAPLPDPAPMTPNVSCERCHGPARAHVEAARAGRDRPPLPSGPTLRTSNSQLGLCGQCHRHPSRFDPALIRPDNPQIVRFQPIGLTQSKCFTRSEGGMTCATCHDPHARASSDRSDYDAKCLACHDRPSLSKKPCPVSPRSDCTSCHMPRVDAGQHVLFADHWIRVPKATDRHADDKPRSPSDEATGPGRGVPGS